MNTLAEACELAAKIAGDARISVIAIGRFVMAAELVGERADQLPWGVSVVSRDDPSLVGRVWNEKDWIEFRACALAKVHKSKHQAKAAAAPPAEPERRDAKHREQLSLFE